MGFEFWRMNQILVQGVLEGQRQSHPQRAHSPVQSNVVGFERIALQLQRALQALGDGDEIAPETRELIDRGREQL